MIFFFLSLQLKNKEVSLVCDIDNERVNEIALIEIVPFD